MHNKSHSLFPVRQALLNFSNLVLDIFPQIYASICQILSRQTFTHSCVSHFPINLHINLSWKTFTHFCSNPILEILSNPILSQNLNTGPDKTYDLFFLKLTFFCRTWIFFLKFTHVFVATDVYALLLKSLPRVFFSYPCLGQNLSSTPATR